MLSKQVFGSIHQITIFFYEGLLLKINQTQRATHVALDVFDLNEKREMHLLPITYDLKAERIHKKSSVKIKSYLAMSPNENIETCSM